MRHEDEHRFKTRSICNSEELGHEVKFEPTNLKWVIIDIRLKLWLEPYLPKLVGLMQVRHEDESSLTLYLVVRIWARS